jgi:hypothetical protein
LQFTCIRRLPGDTDHQLCSRLQKYCSQWGHVVSATLTPRTSSSISSLLRPRAEQLPNPVEVIVEMESPAAAQQILQARQQVQFFSKRHSKSTPQQALPAPVDIGYLRSSACSCRGRTSVPCSCQRYCK